MATPRNNPTELAPKLEIFDSNEVLQKTFETLKTNPSPTQDIKITDIVLEWGVGSNWGKLVFVINDDSNLLTKNSLRRESTIERQWRVKLQLGKSSTTKETWFEGKILETEILRPQTSRQQLIITCVGWGDVLRNRYTKLIRNQAKLADGLDVDDTDTAARIDELVFDLINGVDHQIDDNFVPLTTTGIAGLVTYLNFHRVLLDLQSGNHGSQTGTETFTNGLYGKMYGNRATEGEQITLQNEALFDFMDFDKTWSLFVRLRGTTTVANSITKKGDAWELSIDTNNDIKMQLDGQSITYDSSVEGINVRDGNSHSILFTYGGSNNGLLYIDGVLATVSGSFSGLATFVNDTAVTIGDTLANTPNFDFEEWRNYTIEIDSDGADLLHNAPLKTESSDEFVCPTCLDIKIPNVNMTYSSYASAISRLMGLANVMWMVDPNKHLVARDPFAHDSGFLFTNELGSLEEQNWDSTKLGYIIGAPVSWTDSSAQSLYNIIHGVGPFSPLLDNSNESVPDASDRLDTEWHAIPFKMKNDNLFKIAVKAIKIGTPTGIAEVLITGGDLTLGPNTDDTRRTLKLNTVTLNKLTDTVPAPYFEIPIKPRLPVTPDEQLFIVFKKFGTGTDRYNVNYFVNTSSGNLAFWDSTNGTSWTKQTTVGEGVFRAWSGRRIELTVEMINSSEKLVTPREKLIPLRADMEELTARQALIAASSALGKSSRTYSAITITAPDKRPPLLKFCKIVDSKTGLAVKANMIGMNLEMHSQSPSSLGADRITLMMEDLF